MRASVCLPWLLTAALGCSANFDNKNAGTSGTTGDGPGSDGGGSGGEGSGDGSGGEGTGDDGATVDDLVDLKSALDASASGCQDVDGTPHPGAASYFYGELEPTESEDGEGPQWRGTEEWILFANDAWRDTGVSDCVVTWSVQAEEVAPGACAACDVSVAVAATVDIANTSCPEGLWEGVENYAETYDIRLDTDGTSTWFFGGSGTMMGTGSYVDFAMNYVTERSCVWF